MFDQGVLEMVLPGFAYERLSYLPPFLATNDINYKYNLFICMIYMGIH